MNEFDYDGLRKATEAAENAKKSLAILTRMIEENRPRVREQLEKLDLLEQSMDKRAKDHSKKMDLLLQSMDNRIARLKKINQRLKDS